MENSRKLQILEMAYNIIKRLHEDSIMYNRYKYSICYCFDILNYEGKISGEEKKYFLDIIHKDMLESGYGYRSDSKIKIEREEYVTFFWAWNPYSYAPRKKWFVNQIKLAESV